MFQKLVGKERGFDVSGKVYSKQDKNKKEGTVLSCRNVLKVSYILFHFIKIYFKNILCKRIRILNNLLFTLTNSI